MPDSADGSPATGGYQYALPPVSNYINHDFSGRVDNLKPGVTYDVRAYTSHVPAAWTGGSFERSAVQGKEIYGAADPIITDAVSVTLGSIPSPPRLNNLEVQDDEITASWDEPVVIGADRLTGYELQWKKSSASTWNEVPISASNRSYTLTVAESVEYEVRVKAKNVVGESDWSETRRAEGNPPQSQLVADRPTESEDTGDEEESGEEEEPADPPPPPPDRISATFENVPDSHDGTQFTIDLKFGEDIPVANGPGYGSLDVINGYIANYYRRSARLYRYFIQPNHVGQDVRILKHEGTCGGVGACNADGKLAARIGYITIKSQIVAPVISRDNAAREGSSVDFTITLSRSIAMPVTFDYKTSTPPPPYNKAFRSDSCRTPAGWNRNPDLIKQSGSITFQPGDSSKTISISTCPADSIDEPDRYFTLQLSGTTFDGVRTGLGRIYNEGALQSAWLARLGRTVGTQITDAVTGRFNATGHARIAGLDLGSLRPRSHSAAPVQSFDGRRLPERERQRDPQTAEGGSPGARDLLLGSSFHHAIEDYAAWGNFRQSDFAGSEIHNGNTLHLDGTVLTGVFGADVTRGRLLAGAAVAWTDARGSFGATADSGTLTSRLTTLAPYARVRLTERLSAFGLVGYGAGDTTIEQAVAGSDTHAAVTLDHTMRLAAAASAGAASAARPATSPSVSVRDRITSPLSLWLPRPPIARRSLPLLLLLLLHGEGEQDVARHEAQGAVAGVDEEHPARHRRAGAVQRAAARGHAVDRLDVADGVDVPDDAARGGVVGAQVAVEAAREDDAGDAGDGGRLAGAAAGPRAAGVLEGRGVPDRGAVRGAGRRSGRRPRPAPSRALRSSPHRSARRRWRSPTRCRRGCLRRRPASPTRSRRSRGRGRRARPTSGRRAAARARRRPWSARASCRSRSPGPASSGQLARPSGVVSKQAMFHASPGRVCWVQRISPVSMVRGP